VKGTESVVKVYVQRFDRIPDLRALFLRYSLTSFWFSSPSLFKRQGAVINTPVLHTTWVLAKKRMREDGFPRSRLIDNNLREDLDYVH